MLENKRTEIRRKVTRDVPNLTKEDERKLTEIFPQVFSEGKIDFEKLKAALGEFVDSRPERFTFSWAGRRNAIQIIQMPTRATLVPEKGESINFDATHNLFIEGDNLEVLKLLYKPYFERVKMIYIDPPYNTGNEFVYSDDYADPLESYLKLSGQKNVEGNLLTTNPETSGRFHSAWLSMMYPRLFLARHLLRDDGVIFVSIDDHEAHNLRLIMNEIFGEGAFVADVVVVNNLKGRSDRRYIATAHERLLIYTREQFAEQGLALPEARLMEFDLEDDVGKYRLLGLRKRGGADTREERPKMFFPIFVNPESGKVSLEQVTPDWVEVLPRKSDGTDGAWRWNAATVRLRIASLLGKEVGNGQRFDVFEKDYLATDGEIRRLKPKSVMSGTNYSTDGATKAFRALFPEAPFSNPKSVPFMKDLISYAVGPDENGMVLDFFAGSCTTAQAVLELNHEDGGDRHFIMVQLQEPTGDKEYPSISDVGKERIRRVISQLRKKDAAEQTELVESNGEDLGFRVFSLAESNYKPWKGVEEKTTEAYAAEMNAHVDSLVKDWNMDGVIYEVALKEGLSLTISIQHEEKYANNKVLRVTDSEKGQFFLICLDDKIESSTVRTLEISRNEMFVCRDTAIDDTTAANLALQCILKTI